jgi:hypothetical protein
MEHLGRDILGLFVPLRAPRDECIDQLEVAFIEFRKPARVALRGVDGDALGRGFVWAAQLVSLRPVSSIL